MVLEEKSPNSPLTQRALCVQLGKESVDTLKSIELFDKDITHLKMPFVINSKGHDMEFIVNAPTGMWDRKAADLLMGSGGAYCDVCTHSKEDCLDVELIKAGIPINRTVQSCNEVFERLQDDDGCIFRQKGDYSERQGQTSKPILKEEILSVQVLHSLLRCFDHFMKIVTYVKAGVYN